MIDDARERCKLGETYACIVLTTGTDQEGRQAGQGRRYNDKSVTNSASVYPSAHVEHLAGACRHHGGQSPVHPLGSAGWLAIAVALLSSRWLLPAIFHAGRASDSDVDGTDRLAAACRAELGVPLLASGRRAGRAAPPAARLAFADAKVWEALETRSGTARKRQPIGGSCSTHSTIRAQCALGCRGWSRTRAFPRQT